MIAGNIQRQPFYRKYVNNHYDLPGADFIHDCGFYCGNYPELTDTDLETLVVASEHIDITRTYMVIVRLIGGLGNQLFQYAAARRVAHMNGVPLKLDV